MTTRKSRPYGGGLPDLADHLHSRPAPTSTVADELHEVLVETDDCLNLVLGNIGYLTEVIRGKRARRLARRRHAATTADTAPLLDTLDWVLSEALDQLEELTGVLVPLLEPPRGSQTRYGLQTGIFPYTPFHGACGTPGGYQQHRRRGEDCQPCRKAACEYNAERRRAASCDTDSFAQIFNLIRG